MFSELGETCLPVAWSHILHCIVKKKKGRNMLASFKVCILSNDFISHMAWKPAGHMACNSKNRKLNWFSTGEYWMRNRNFSIDLYRNYLNVCTKVTSYSNACGVIQSAKLSELCMYPGYYMMLWSSCYYWKASVLYAKSLTCLIG